ncbi:MAG: PEGA domain-containing protein [Lentisphaeria bacterium]|nr:PEGA domain-containing protein [Lentisphaeria bacterium]MBO7153071.1 PEGA domain-containing protein [Lentisphaeria bacterium]
MSKIYRFITGSAAALMLISAVHADSTSTSTSTSSTSTKTTTTTTTVITKTVVRQKKEEVKWTPFKVCVLDFETVDTKGAKRFLDHNNKPIEIPAQSTLNDADRKSVNAVMQGFVRMIDAWDNSKTADANRAAQAADNNFSRKKAIAIYNQVANGETRPMIAGAEYLSAYLGRRNNVFSCVDSSVVAAAMQKLQAQPDFPKDFMRRLAQETGLTHLVYGTITDMRTKTNSFTGYGISTKTTNYQLDVIIKVVDLVAQQTVYSNVYTGTYKEQRPISGTQFDNNIFQNLMTSALEQAAEELYDLCKPGRRNRISVTPMPRTITLNVSGNILFKPATAEVYIDGTFAGNAAESFALPEGKHSIEIKAAGYKSKKLDVNVSKDLTINVQLEK